MIVFIFASIFWTKKSFKMAKILMFGNQKGGVGKTQVSIMTATALSQKPFNLKTCVVDIDNQKSVIRARNFDLRAYQTENTPFEALNFSVGDLQKNIATLDKDFQLIVIDAAGKLDTSQPVEIQEISKALMYVDHLFIPFVAGNYNLESTLDYFRFIKTVQLQRAVQPRPLNVVGVVNMHRPRSRANAFLSEDLATLQSTEQLLMMKTPLNDYAAFREADTITSLYDPLSNDSAKLNFTAWLNELIALIQ
jgi:chromosome partitioning protein